MFLVFLGTQLLLSEHAHGEDDNLDLVLKLNSFVTISKLISGPQFFVFFFSFFPFLKNDVIRKRRLEQNLHPFQH